MTAAAVLGIVRGLDVLASHRTDLGRDDIRRACTALSTLTRLLNAEYTAAANDVAARRAYLHGDMVAGGEVLDEGAGTGPARRVLLLVCDMNVVRVSLVPGLLRFAAAHSASLLPELLLLFVALTAPPVADPSTLAQQRECLHKLRRELATDPVLHAVVAAVAPLTASRLDRALDAVDARTVDAALMLLRNLLYAAPAEAEAVVGAMCRTHAFELLLTIVQQNHSAILELEGRVARHRSRSRASSMLRDDGVVESDDGSSAEDEEEPADEEAEDEEEAGEGDGENETARGDDAPAEFALDDAARSSVIAHITSAVAHSAEFDELQLIDDDGDALVIHDLVPPPITDDPNRTPPQSPQRPSAQRSASAFASPTKEPTEAGALLQSLLATPVKHTPTHTSLGRYAPPSPAPPAPALGAAAAAYTTSPSRSRSASQGPAIAGGETQLVIVGDVLADSEPLNPAEVENALNTIHSASPFRRHRSPMSRSPSAARAAAASVEYTPSVTTSAGRRTADEERAHAALVEAAIASAASDLGTAFATTEDEEVESELLRRRQEEDARSERAEAAAAIENKRRRRLGLGTKRTRAAQEALEEDADVEGLNQARRWSFVILDAVALAFRLAPAASVAGWSHHLVEAHNAAAAAEAAKREVAAARAEIDAMRTMARSRNGPIASTGLIVRRVQGDVQHVLNAGAPQVEGAARPPKMLAIGAVSSVLAAPNTTLAIRDVDNRKKARFQRKLLQPLVEFDTMPPATQRQLAQQFHHFSEMGFAPLSVTVWEAIATCITVAERTYDATAATKRRERKDGAEEREDEADLDGAVQHMWRNAGGAEIFGGAGEYNCTLDDVVNFSSLGGTLLRFSRIALRLFLERQRLRALRADGALDADDADALLLGDAAAADGLLSLNIIGELVSLQYLRPMFGLLRLLLSIRAKRHLSLTVATFLGEALRLLVHMLDGDVSSSDEVKAAGASMAAVVAFEPTCVASMQLLWQRAAESATPLTPPVLEATLRFGHAMILLLERVSSGRGAFVAANTRRPPPPRRKAPAASTGDAAGDDAAAVDGEVPDDDNEHVATGRAATPPPAVDPLAFDDEDAAAAEAAPPMGERSAFVADVVVKLADRKMLPIYIGGLTHWRAIADDAVESLTFLLRRLMEPDCLGAHRILFFVGALLPLLDVVLTAREAQPALWAVCSEMLTLFLHVTDPLELQLRIARCIFPLSASDIAILEERSEDPVLLQCRDAARSHALQQESLVSARHRKAMGWTAAPARTPPGGSPERAAEENDAGGENRPQRRAAPRKSRKTTGGHAGGNVDLAEDIMRAFEADEALDELVVEDPDASAKKKKKDKKDKKKEKAEKEKSKKSKREKKEKRERRRRRKEEAGGEEDGIGAATPSPSSSEDDEDAYVVALMREEERQNEEDQRDVRQRALREKRLAKLAAREAAAATSLLHDASDAATSAYAVPREVESPAAVRAGSRRERDADGEEEAETLLTLGAAPSSPLDAPAASVPASVTNAFTAAATLFDD